MNFSSSSAVVAAALLGLGSPAHGADTRVEFIVMGANSSQGTMRAMLCTENERFPNGCRLSARAPARVEGTRVVFANLTPGRYAFSVVHDEDDSGRLGISSISGKPKGIGFSNNVTGPGGVPTFNLAAIDVKDAEFKQVVKLRSFGFAR